MKFAVQVKGTRTAKSRRGTIGLKLKTAHLIHYVDVLREPVFLVVVDVTTRTGYWLFVQQHVLESLSSSDWRNKKYTTLRIPLENKINDAPKLFQAALGADHFMASLHPVALVSALIAEKQKFESRDNRFNVQVRVDTNQISYEFLPKIEVQAKLLFTGTHENLSKKLDDLFGRGEPVVFQKGEIDVEGLPIKEEIADGAKIQFARQFSGSLTLVGVDGAGKECGRMESLQGTFIGGYRETRFEANLGDSPFGILLTITWENQLPRISLRVDFRSKRWGGQPLSELCYFDQLFAVFGNESFVGLDIECSVRGNRLFTGHTKSDENRLGLAASAIRSIFRARRIASYFGLDPLFPPDLRLEELREVDALYDIVFGGGYHRPAAGERLSAPLSRPNLQNIRSLLGTDFTSATSSLSLVGGPRRFPFLRSEIELERLEFCLTHARLVNDRASIASILSGEIVELFWEGADEAEMIIRQK